MSNNERRCINPWCRRLLIDEDEKLICSRCKRKASEAIKKLGPEVGAGLAGGLGVIALLKHKMKFNNDNKPSNI